MNDVEAKRSFSLSPALMLMRLPLLMYALGGRRRDEAQPHFLWTPMQNEKCPHRSCKVNEWLSHCIHCSCISPSLHLILPLSQYFLYFLSLFFPAEKDPNSRRGEKVCGPERDGRCLLICRLLTAPLLAQSVPHARSAPTSSVLEKEASSRRHTWKKIFEISDAMKNTRTAVWKTEQKLHITSCFGFLLGVFAHWVSFFIPFFPFPFRLKRCCIHLKWIWNW